MTTKLIIVRGPSGSGKSTVSKDLLKRASKLTLLVSEDQVRKMFNDHQKTGHEVAKEVATKAVITGLNKGYDVIYEGILNVKSSGDNLDEIFKVHPTENYLFYLDVDFDETIRRHQTRPESSEFNADSMKKWWDYSTPAGHKFETIISGSLPKEEIIKKISKVSGIELVV